jgi:NADPH-dependent ferric siderophore reductase
MTDATLSTRRVERVRHDTKRRDLEVVRVAEISPHVRSVTLAGESLHDFTSLSFDDHVKLMLDEDRSTWRDYTPRSFDRAQGELTIEFVLHGDGPAAQWAAQARPGQRATVAGPRGSFVVPLDYDWHLLAGDESALPAIARRLEELPASSRAIVIAQAADEGDRRDLASAAKTEVIWVSHDAELVAAVRGIDLSTGDGYAWCAGEAHAMAALRGLLLDEKGIDRHHLRAAAYWKHGAVAHHENLES